MSSRRATWKSSLLLLILIVMGAGSGAIAATKKRSRTLKQTLGLTTSFRSAYFSEDRSFDGNENFAVGSLWVTSKPRLLFLGMSSFFDARVQNQSMGKGKDSEFKWELREAYYEANLGSVDVRFGRQIVIWGRADKINPTDLWTTRDHTLLCTEDEDQRLGVGTMTAKWSIGNGQLIGLWQPEWRFPILPFPSLPAGVTVHNVDPKDPASQYGLKFDYAGGDLDWSISYAHSLDRTPDLSVLSATPLDIGLNYKPIDVIGLDAAAPVGEYGLRAEIAHIQTKDKKGDDPLIKNSNLFSVLGIERTFGGTFNINLQYLYRQVMDFKPPTVVLGEQENLLSNQLAEQMHGASLRLSHKAWNETLDMEVATVTWFKKNDSLVRPKISYAISDRFKAVVGGEFFMGPANSFFGQLQKASTGFAELRYNW